MKPAGYLASIAADLLSFAHYFEMCGADISYWGFGHPGDLWHIEQFIKAEGNNKLLYLTGHGGENGYFVLQDGSYLSFAPLPSCKNAISDWLEASSFRGTLTIVLDMCFAA